jgi:hypothetical protein
MGRERQNKNRSDVYNAMLRDGESGCVGSENVRETNADFFSFDNDIYFSSEKIEL